MAMNMFKNGNFNDILSSMANQSSSSGGNQTEGNGNIDLNSLMETFMPLLNSLTSNSNEQSDDEQSQPSVKAEFKNEINLPEDSEDQDNQEIYSNENRTVPNTVDNHRPVRIKQRRRR